MGQGRPLRVRVSGLAAAAVVAGLAVVLIRMLLGTTYTSQIAFVTSGSGPASRFSGLAAQFGLSGLQGEPGSSPMFYVELIRSPGFLADVARRLLGGTDTTTVTELIRRAGASGKDQSELPELLGRYLGKELRVAANLDAGTVRVGWRSRSAVQSALVTASVRDELLRFDIEKREFRARAERRFLELVDENYRDSLAVAQSRLVGFLSGNREIEQSALLRARRDELQMDVQRLRDVRTSIGGSLLQARMEEVRDTPRFTILQDADVPSAPDAVPFALLFVVGATFGLMLAAAYLFRTEVAALLRRVGAG